MNGWPFGTCRSVRMGLAGLGLVTSVVAVVAMTTTSAHAQGWEWRRGAKEARLDPDDGGLATELTLFVGEVGAADALLASPRFGGWYAPQEHIELSLDWGLAIYRERNGGTHRVVRAGNPVFSGYYVGRADHVDIRAGLSVAMPVARSASGRQARAVEVALASRGEWNRWAWLPETVTLAFPLRIETRANRALLLAGEGAVGVPIRLGGDVDGVLQIAGEVGYRGDNGSVAMRMQAVWQASEPQFAQLSLEPFARFRAGSAFFTARLTMNLDAPHGFAFEPQGIWGMHVGAGVRL